MKKRLVLLTKWSYRLVHILPFLLLLAAAAYMRQREQSTGGYKHPIGGGDLRYLKDSQNAYTIDSVASLPDKAFTSASSPIVNFGFSRASYWLKFTICGAWTNGERQFLELRNPLLNEVVVYERYGQNVVKRYTTGDTQPFETRALDHPNFVFPLDIPFDESREYYVKVSSGGEQFAVPIIVWNNIALNDRDHRNFLFHGAYFGIILFVLLFNLFIYLVVKESSSLYYMHYNLNLLLLQAALSGLAFQHFWPHSPYLANVANPVFASLGIFALLRFSQNFLSLREYFPKVNKAFSYIGYLVMLNAFAALFWQRDVFYITVITINGVAFLLNIAIFPISYAVWRKGFRPARFFLFGFAVLILTVFAFIVNNFGWVNNGFFSQYGLQIGSALEVVLLSFAIVHRFKDFKQKSLSTLRAMNQLEREQNIVLEQKVEERTVQLQAQTEKVAAQNDEILSSIRYARRIQASLLPSDSEVIEILKQGFVLYKPKDIVSGDFYWVHRFEQAGEEWTLFAIADCTGHGVPGALMSVMGQNLLKESVRECVEIDPAMVLDKLNAKVISNLANQSHYEYASDGMDIAVGMFSRTSRRLLFAGANNGLLIVRDKEVRALEGDKRSIGMPSPKNFHLQTFQLHEGDHVYASTDGLRDQFGGERGKKLKSSGVCAWLQEAMHLDIRLHAQMLEHKFMQWKGELEQVDDVCMLGVKV